MEGGPIKMSFPYPAKPWFDGQTFTVNLDSRYVMTGTYYAAKNVWSFVRTDLEGGIDAAGDIYTPNVLSLNARPEAVEGAVVPFADPSTISSQQAINWYLHDLVQENLKDPDLKEVLDAGNVADKNIFLTNGEDDLIDLSVTEKRIVLGVKGEESVPKFELRHFNGIDQSNAAIEIDDGGKRLDFEAEGKIDNMHFRFGNTDKLILNKTGDAVFSGKVQGVPGTQNNEFVTYGQLLTVEEELEQLAPSLERGTWTYTSNSNPGPGQYTLIKEMLTQEDQEALCNIDYQQCLVDAGGDPSKLSECNRIANECTGNVVPGGKLVTTDQFAEAAQILFNEIDSKGVEHEFGGIDDDHLLDLFNEDDDAFGVYDIVTHGSGLFDVDVLSTRGAAVDLARLKIFKQEGAVDFDQYVRKAGDTMTGLLTFAPTLNPTSSNHVTHKRYVDEQVGTPTTLGWKVTTENTSNPISGEARFDGTNMSNSTEVRINFTSIVGNLDLYGWTDNTTIYSGDGSHFMLSAYYTGSDVDYKWKHKGFANIAKIETYKRKDTWYFLVKLGDKKTANGSFSSGGTYYLTIPGLF